MSQDGWTPGSKEQDEYWDRLRELDIRVEEGRATDEELAERADLEKKVRRYIKPEGPLAPH